ncbi:methyl-accepting chemotaxis protein [Desulfotruncus alcoholivorax]|uniref:methyl-accepting chemotaxis protein n=1 Tax=Desulfotruncus alcoholivorax TaxID=265477 RepID=UPI0004088BC4|nr:methyl-accepting chemotaxis protein [Desulfotruncus alcoholivorax]
MYYRTKISIRTKLTSMFLILSLLSTVIVAAIIYRTIYSQVESNFTDSIINTAIIAALKVDGDQQEKLIAAADMSSENYKDVRTYFQQIQNQLHIPYVYTLYSKDGKVYFAVDGDPEKPCPIGEEYSWESGMKKAFAGTPSCTDGFYTDEWGTFKSAYAPIKNSAGQVVAILGADFPADKILDIKKKIIVNIAVPLLVIYFICFMVSMWLARKISDPLIKLREGCVLMSTGDLTHNFNIKSNDEIGQLAESINGMAGSLKQLVANVKEKANSVASFSQELYSTSEEVSATVEELAGTTNKVAATSAKDADNAKAATIRSKQARHVAEEGNRAVSDTIEKINSIASSSQNLASAIQELGEQSSKIGEIINTITNIADQTNLLALNAAIEAARAGEFGRGFAVVAEEVRQLAEQSAGAANEITSLISEIQINMENVKGAMENGAKEVAEGVQIASKTGASLKQIIKAIDDNTAIMKDIAEGTKHANESAKQLATSNEQIALSVQQVTNSAQELANIAEELQAAIVQFKVD